MIIFAQKYRILLIGSFNRATAPLILREVLDLDADILALQECSPKMFEALVAALPDHAAADMCVVCVLSHGRHGLVAAADGREMETEWLIRQFNNAGCPGLAMARRRERNGVIGHALVETAIDIGLTLAVADEEDAEFRGRIINPDR